jgi:hypothetical protein
VIRNPDDSVREYEDMVERFHGRAPRGEIEIVEEEEYDDYGAVLGQLIEMMIMCPDERHGVPITFSKTDKLDTSRLDQYVQVVSDAKGKNIRFVGGNQDIDLAKLARYGLIEETGKNLVIIGPVMELVYFADKHHLEGPATQKKGVAYRHELGEQASKLVFGEMPTLVYDVRNQKMMFASGSYEVRDEGIWN